MAPIGADLPMGVFEICRCEGCSRRKVRVCPPVPFAAAANGIGGDAIGHPMGKFGGGVIGQAINWSMDHLPLWTVCLGT